MELPRIVRVRQALRLEQLEDPYAAARAEVELLLARTPVQPGATVAITAGSRGITDIVPVLKAAVDAFRAAGAEPCIVPSMGSHGGATAEGQVKFLGFLGITEESMGAPIRSSMETAILGVTGDGLPVHLDKIAAGCSHILAVNRVKPHTEFSGRVESGLTKMLVIGLGKHLGALETHQYAVRLGYERALISAGEVILAKAPVIGGLGIVENGVGMTCAVRLVEPATWFEVEGELLDMARATCPKLPFDPLDVLVIDESGKRISGTGMDTKVIGRIMNIYEKELTKPKITRIVLRDLAKPNDGNALGIGLVDFITKKVADQVNFAYTMVNCVTAVTPEKGRMPLVCATDEQALEQALASAGPTTPETIRLAWVRNTSDLEEMWVSTALAEEARGREGMEILGEPVAMRFDANGDLFAE